MSNAEETVAADAVIFPNWASFSIKGRQSTRSACPHYKGVPPHGAGGDDKQQDMDAPAISYLKGKGVKYVISANAIELTPVQKSDLQKAGIGYLWVPVPDFGAPDIAKFKKAHDGYVANKSGVHFYCGWGNGRSGTYITGVEILEGVYPSHKPTRADYDRNKTGTGATELEGMRGIGLAPNEGVSMSDGGGSSSA
ncbi:hypothetical protein BDY19DRAFT_989549 [Irpex rosettiformis]|uniref:Uncharacterized protein n=1 Tax=Irpex rosettiformis TaxID=378272 RepID=A0ACB8UI31_9APHY|nr:hypothetical protein BDY19DRAFT_989549 [Irpex rosettiformis]